MDGSILNSSGKRKGHYMKVFQQEVEGKKKNINAERRNKNVPCRAGWYMNDMVLCENKTAWIYGFGGGEKGKQCLIRDINNEIVRTSNLSSKTPNVAMSNLKLICHNNNWQYILIC